MRITAVITPLASSRMSPLPLPGISEIRYCHSCRPLIDCPDLLGPAAGNLSLTSNKEGGIGRSRDGVHGECKARGVGSAVDYVEDDDLMDPVADDLERIERLLDHMERSADRVWVTYTSRDRWYPLLSSYDRSRDLASVGGVIYTIHQRA